MLKTGWCDLEIGGWSMSETRGPEKSKKADDSDDASVTDRIQNMIPKPPSAQALFWFFRISTTRSVSRQAIFIIWIVNQVEF